MDVLKEIEYGLEIDELEKYLNKRTIAMIGLIDEIGYTPDNYNYLDRILSSLKIEAPKLTVFNAHFKTFNLEQYIEDFLEGNISLAEVKKIKHQENNQKIERILKDKGLPADPKLYAIARDFLKIEEDRILISDPNTKLRDVIKEHDDVNIFYSANTSLLTEVTPYYLIKEQKRQREKNYHYILSLNPNAKIYAIGLMTPRKQRKISRDIEEMNDFYQELSTKYGMIYIDPKGLEDFLKTDITGYYLNAEGIAHLSLRCIQAMYQRKIKEKFNPGLKINMPQMNEDTLGIKYLLQTSKEREHKSQEELQQNNLLLYWKKNFLMDSIQEEIEKQKIYKQSK